jgi:hypothetical protein
MQITKDNLSKRLAELEILVVNAEKAKNEAIGQLIECQAMIAFYDHEPEKKQEPNGKK